MRLHGFRLEFRVELAAEKPWVVGDFDDLHQGAVGRGAADDEPGLHQPVPELDVELEPVPVAFLDPFRSVGPVGEGAGFEDARVGAEPQGPAHVRHLVAGLDLVGPVVEPLLHEIDDRVGGGAVELGGVGVFHPRHVAGELYHGQLHAEADTEEGDLPGPGVVDGVDLAAHPPGTEAAGDQDAVAAGQQAAGVFFFQVLGRYISQLDGGVVGHAAVHQGLVQALVRFLQIDVLADDGDYRLLGGVGDLVEQFLPGLQPRRAGPDIEQFQDLVVQALLVKAQGHLVDVLHVLGGDHLVGAHVAEQGDLGLQFLGERHLGTAEQDVGLDADGAQLLDRVLGGLGLHLAGGLDVGHQGDVDEQAVLAADIDAELADRLQEGQTLDVADGAADLDDGHVGVAFELADGLLDLVGDVGDDLHGAAQVFAPSFLGDHRVVDAA